MRQLSGWSTLHTDSQLRAVWRFAQVQPQRALSQSTTVPRASAVNVVNHIGYNAATRTHAAAGEGLEKAQLWEKLVNPSSEFNDNLFWVVLPHFEGELRVGLGTVLYSTGVKPSHTLMYSYHTLPLSLTTVSHTG